VRADADEAHGMGEAHGAENEVALFERDEAQEELVTVVDGIEGGTGLVVPGERDIVAERAR